MKSRLAVWVLCGLAVIPVRAEPLLVEGLLMPYEQARLASRAQGVIATIREEGDEVRKGDVVMQLETEMEQLQVRQQEHIRALREVEHHSAEELGRKDAISKNEREEKRISLEVAKVQHDQTKELLARRSLYAPFDGVIAERLRQRGEAVDEFVPVLLLADINLLALEAYLPSKLISVVAAGQKVIVRVHDLPERTFEGEVTKVSPVVNAASGEFKIKITVPNPKREISAGMRASAEIALPENAVPSSKMGN